MIRTLNNLVIGLYLKILKGIYENPIAIIILNGEKLVEFPQGFGTRQRCSHSPLLFNTVGERNKKQPNWKG
jgi:hypothetical protein